MQEAPVLFYDNYVKRFLFAFGVFALFVLVLPPLTHAADPSISCTLETTPKAITTESEKPGFKITTQGLSNGNKYYLFLNELGISPDGFAPLVPNTNSPFTLNNNEIKLDNLTPPLKYRATNINALAASTYSLTVTKSNIGSNSDLCRVTFNVQNATQGNKACTIDFMNTEFKNDKDIIIRVATPPNEKQTVVRIKRDGPNGPDAFYACVDNNKLTNSQGYTLPNSHLENGKYYMYLATTVGGTCGSAGGLSEQTACFTSFAVPGGIESQGNPTPTPLPPPCAEYIKDSEGNERCGSVKTGLGINIGTDLDSFIKAVFSFLLGFAGGIAILLIMVSGYRIATSQGDAEVLKNAREQITAAVVGLIFVVFSLVILQIIGVNILNIPGFGK